MAVKLVESASVELKNEQIILSAQNLDPEGLGLVSTADVKILVVAYHQNEVAIDKVIQALEKLKEFCHCSSMAFQNRALGRMEQAAAWDRKAELQYNQLPAELKW